MRILFIADMRILAKTTLWLLGKRIVCLSYINYRLKLSWPIAAALFAAGPAEATTLPFPPCPTLPLPPPRCPPGGAPTASPTSPAPRTPSSASRSSGLWTENRVRRKRRILFPSFSFWPALSPVVKRGCARRDPRYDSHGCEDQITGEGNFKASKNMRACDSYARPCRFRCVCVCAVAICATAQGEESGWSWKKSQQWPPPLQARD